MTAYCKWSGVDPGFLVKRGEIVYCPGCRRPLQVTTLGLLPMHKKLETPELPKRGFGTELHEQVSSYANELSTESLGELTLAAQHPPNCNPPLEHVYVFEVDHGYFRCACGRTEAMLTRYEQ